VIRFVADVGNTRLKLARLDDAGALSLSQVEACEVHDRDARRAAIERLGGQDPGARWTIASVNPPALDGLLAELAGPPVRLVRSALDVPMRHALVHPESTGADRAVGVREAARLQALDLQRGCGGQVVLAGTAITVERIDRDGAWTGGAIAIGPGLAASALGSRTAQLPVVAAAPRDLPPASWGVDTDSALRAGLHWGAVGAVREILSRQADSGEGLGPAPWLVIAGGDAAWIASGLNDPRAQVRPHLVLEGLAAMAMSGPDA
jgi:type III pantothenate kinase